jgi:hypothetical protein
MKEQSSRFDTSHWEMSPLKLVAPSVKAILLGTSWNNFPERNGRVSYRTSKREGRAGKTGKERAERIQAQRREQRGLVRLIYHAIHVSATSGIP